MFKKNKQLIIGFILGALLFSIVPVSATIEEFILNRSETKLTLDGADITDENLPILIMKPGYNYIPAGTFKEICDKMGVGFEWVGSSNEIQISTVKNISVPPTEERNGQSMNRIEKDGYQLLVVDGVEYISFKEIHNHYNKQGYNFGYDEDKNQTYFYKNSDEKIILLQDIQISAFNGISHIKYEFFKNNILTLIN